jgi:hypothetical protein
MAVELPGGIKGLNPSPTDAWSGPYSSVGEANLSINPLVRYKTMIVRIVSDLYWYRDGIEDANLVLFNGGKYNSTVPYLPLALPTKDGFINTTIGSNLAYTAGSLISVVGTPSVYYLDVTGTSTITFNKTANVDVFMIGGGGGGGGGQYSSTGGGGGAGGYKNVVSIPVAKDTTLNITVGAGGTAGSTTVTGGSGGDTVIANSQTPTVDILRVKGGGGGGGDGGASTTWSGLQGGCGGGGAGIPSTQNNGIAGGISNKTTADDVGSAGGKGFGNGDFNNTLCGGGGGGCDGVGKDGNLSTTVAGAGGTSKTLTVLKDPFTFGGGGGGGARNATAGMSGGGGGGGGGVGAGNGGNATANTGSGGGGGGGGGPGPKFIGGAGGAGGSGRVILKVKTPVNINPLSTAVGPASLISYPDTTTTNKFEGIVSVYNRATGLIEITNIQNISGTFAVPSDYTFDVNTVNGVNAGTNIEIINSKINLSINSDIQMNGKAIVSPNALYLTVPFTNQALSGDATNFMLVNVNGSDYKIKLFPA